MRLSFFYWIHLIPKVSKYGPDITVAECFRIISEQSEPHPSKVRREKMARNEMDIDTCHLLLCPQALYIDPHHRYGLLLPGKNSRITRFPTASRVSILYSWLPLNPESCVKCPVCEAPGVPVTIYSGRQVPLFYALLLSQCTSLLEYRNLLYCINMFVSQTHSRWLI